MEESSFIVCMNCEDYIQTDLIELHSLICHEPHYKVLNMEKQDRNKFLHYKIAKLNCSIELIVQERSVYPKTMFFLRTLLIFSQGLFKIPVNSPNSTELCQQLLEDLQKFKEKILSFPIPLLYADRIIILGTEKLYIIKQYNNKKYYHFLAGKCSFNILRRIDSIVENHSKTDSVFTAEGLYEGSDQEQTQRAEFRVECEANESDQRRIFYNICINQKLMYPPNHSVKDIQLPLVYYKAKKQKIPQQNWEQFIKSEFKNWHNWVK